MSATTELRVCPLAERATRTEVINHLAPSPWVVRRCLETGFVFLENPPGYESLKEELAWQVTYERESQHRANTEPLRYAVSGWLKHLRRNVAKRHKVADMTLAYAVRAAAERAHDEAVHLVDVGCGSGELFAAVMARMPRELKARCRPHGVELSTELARQSNLALAPCGGHCEHATALEGMARFEPGSLDVVVLSSFLEHEVAPLPLLRLCRAALRPGGFVLVKVPNYASWNRRLRGARWCGYRWPDHVNYFTADTLRAMAVRAGLAVERMSWRDRLVVSDSLYAALRRPLSPSTVDGT